MSVVATLHILNTLGQHHEVQLLPELMKSILGDQNARTEREEVKAIFVIYIESFNIQQFSRSIEAADNHEQFLANSITSKLEVLIRTLFKLQIVFWFQSELFTVESKLMSILQINSAQTDTRYHADNHELISIICQPIKQEFNCVYKLEKNLSDLTMILMKTNHNSAIIMLIPYRNHHLFQQLLHVWLFKSSTLTQQTYLSGIQN
ncbi:Hypothetical_protein [Hexamita inflata]|uniref:Hypothetical_protein n=1 Tax=Hexamita inflata TaxID=28002 RepID=A0AA86Q542_9EUKA|nr:Hypothetical protein HINF_LOCUS37167 [Hexamita inflata]